ncbi:GntR family transcriptional regulator [Microbacterium sp. NPDC086615]|uniref:GntR family transcriptional regulator n=1 Tax=Microbacterium sp. NPDC086615 TaxID=3154865 RepID=UPI00341AD658
MTDATRTRPENVTAPIDLHRFFRGLILSGRLGEGEKLPTVRQAAADFGVAPGTVQKAYRALEHEGLIVSRVGSGTRVAPGVAPLPADLTRQLRTLVDAAVAEGVAVDTLADVLRVMWNDAHTR